MDINDNTTKKTDGIILAAGFSSRANAFKMELDCNGKTMLQRTIEAMSLSCSRIIVVGGYRIERIRELTAPYPNVRVVLNQDYPAGMFSSVKRGVREVCSDWFFYIPGDYPLVTPAIYSSLLNARDTHPEATVFIPVFNRRKGHPILLHCSVKEKILAESPGSNLREVIRKEDVTQVPVNDEAILLDVDTPEDYQKIEELKS